MVEVLTSSVGADPVYVIAAGWQALVELSGLSVDAALVASVLVQVTVESGELGSSVGEALGSVRCRPTTRDAHRGSVQSRPSPRTGTAGTSARTTRSDRLRGTTSSSSDRLVTHGGRSRGRGGPGRRWLLHVERSWSSTRAAVTRVLDCDAWAKGAGWSSSSSSRRCRPTHGGCRAGHRSRYDDDVPAATTSTKSPKKSHRVPPKVTDRDEQVKLLRDATSRIRTKVAIDFVKSVRGR